MILAYPGHGRAWPEHATDAPASYARHAAERSAGLVETSAMVVTSDGSVGGKVCDLSWRSSGSSTRRFLTPARSVRAHRASGIGARERARRANLEHGEGVLLLTSTLTVPTTLRHWNLFAL